MKKASLFIEVIDDDFVALRQQLAVDHEDVDSEEELKAEFDFLLQSGKTLPHPIKLEAQTDEENDCDSTEDVVLGEIPRKKCVSILCILCAIVFPYSLNLIFFTLQEQAQDRFIPEYGVTLKYSLYTLLEFYNVINDGADGSYYDEKFVRLLCTGIKLKNHLNQIGSYDLNDKLVMFVNGEYIKLEFSRMRPNRILYLYSSLFNRCVQSTCWNEYPSIEMV